jgi:glycosyltransferase involved in cell wall biosynthesis
MSLAVSVILPVMNETWSLEKTVDILLRDNRDHLEELLIVTSPRTIDASRQTIAGLAAAHPELVRVHQQTLPFLGGALQEAFALARGRTTLLMASDLETDPSVVPAMIATMQRDGCDIVIASRWLQHRSFQGYSRPKFVCNWLFQKFFATLYGVRLSDLTYGFRLYRTDRLRGIRWEELKHSFLFECLVKPLRLGCRVAEVPAVWEPRREGASQNMLSAYAGYFRTGLRVRARRIDAWRTDSRPGSPR